MTKADDAAILEVSTYPLIVYVHVPKTAGATIKKMLSLCSPRGYADAHFVIKKRSFLDLARNSDWISGHVERDRLATNLIWLNRQVEYFASVREPVAQLISHINYSFERYSRGDDYYGSHSIVEQRLDTEVMSIDFSNPTAIMAFLLRHGKHFLNRQSGYVLGADFATNSDDEIERRLATYTFVATEYDLPKLYRAFGFAQLPASRDEIRENVARHRFDPDVFHSTELREFLAHHHKHDLRLYAAVRSTSWPAEGRRPFRPTMLDEQVVTSENFDELSYVYSNPDVAADVKSGLLESGRAHFDSQGYKENRLMWRSVLPPLPAAISEQTSIGADFSASAALDRLRRLREERARMAELQLRQRESAERAAAPAGAELQLNLNDGL
jgi:hypothetical protein